MFFTVLAIAYVLAGLIVCSLYAMHRLHQDVTVLSWEKVIRDFNTSAPEDTSFDHSQLYWGIIDAMHGMDKKMQNALQEVSSTLLSLDAEKSEESWNAKRKAIHALVVYMHRFAPRIAAHMEEYIRELTGIMPYHKYITQETASRFLELVIFIGILLFAPSIFMLSISAHQVIIGYVGCAVIRDAGWGFIDERAVTDIMSDIKNNYTPLLCLSLMTMLIFNPIAPWIHVVCAVLTSQAIGQVWSIFTQDDRVLGRNLRKDTLVQQCSLSPKLKQKRYFCMLPMVYVYVLFPMHASLLSCFLRMFIQAIVGSFSLYYFNACAMPDFFDSCFTWAARIYVYCVGTIEKIEFLSFVERKISSSLMKKDAQFLENAAMGPDGAYNPAVSKERVSADDTIEPSKV